MKLTTYFRRRWLPMILALALLMSLLPLGIWAQEPLASVETVGFDTAADAEKFDLYHSSSGGFTVQNGRLTPAGTLGEFKAIYKGNGQKIRAVSVEMHPNGNDGMYGGLYINASNPGHGQDKIDALYLGVESNFPQNGAAYWPDAPNRVDIVLGKFTQSWAGEAGNRYVSETGLGNALFTGGNKQPLKLRAQMNGNILTVTVSLVDNPARQVSTAYTLPAGTDLSLGGVGIRSHFNNASYDQFTVEYEAEPSQEEKIYTATVDFEDAASQEEFGFYHSSNGGFTVQNGKLTPAGTPGEFKAVYEKPQDVTIRSVSVELHPVGTNGPIYGGLYLNASNPNHGQDQINALYIGVESNFSGWSDAPNRIDLVAGSFPSWQEKMGRVISETGAGNALFTGGVKQPLLLQVQMEGNQAKITLSLLSNPARQISAVCTMAAGVDLTLGDVGIRSHMNNAMYDNFTVEYSLPEGVEPPTEPETEPETEPSVPETEPEEVLVPTDLVDFESADHSDKFDFYHSSNGGFAVEDGKLVPTGETGEFKAVYKDTNAQFSFVSVDIYPGISNNISGGIYVDVTDADHPVDKITAVAALVDASHTGWEDAPNRTDLVFASFPVWTEYHRVISETGAGNALFSGGVKEPVNLLVKIEGNALTMTVSLLSDPSKSVSASYVFAGMEDLSLGNVGIRSAFCDASYDNFAVGYEQVEQDKEPDIAEPEKPQWEPTDVVDFESADHTQKFDFYHSSQGALTIEDGKLVPTGEEGEFKAIYRDGGNKIQGVSVNIYPGQSGQINSGIYIGASTVEDGVDRIKGLSIMVESNHSGWDDAINRIDLVVGRFPIWKELHRYTSETGNGNALFAGAKEPVNLQVDINGNEVTITLSLLSAPDRFVTTVYRYNGAMDLAAHNVGVRSAFNDVSFDDFAVCTVEGGGSADPVEPENSEDGNTGTTNPGTTPGTTPPTGDSFPIQWLVLLMLACVAAVSVLAWKRKRLML